MPSRSATSALPEATAAATPTRATPIAVTIASGPDTRPAASTSSAPATSPRATGPNCTRRMAHPTISARAGSRHSATATARVATTTPGPVGTAAQTASAT